MSSILKNLNPNETRTKAIKRSFKALNLIDLKYSSLTKKYKPYETIVNTIGMMGTVNQASLCPIFDIVNM